MVVHGTNYVVGTLSASPEAFCRTGFVGPDRHFKYSRIFL